MTPWTNLPERRAGFPPADYERVLDAVRVSPGMTVVDVGAGAGGFTLPLARRVGERGKVYAVDAAPLMLRDLEEAVESARWPQIVVRASREGHVPVPDDVLDAAFLIHVLHALDGPGTLRDVRRALKPVGELHVVEAFPEPTPRGRPLEERVHEKDAITFVERAGYRFVRSFTPGGANYGLTFRPA